MFTKGEQSVLTYDVCSPLAWEIFGGVFGEALAWGVLLVLTVGGAEEARRGENVLSSVS